MGVTGLKKFLKSSENGGRVLDQNVELGAFGLNAYTVGVDALGVMYRNAPCAESWAEYLGIDSYDDLCSYLAVLYDPNHYANELQEFVVMLMNTGFHTVVMVFDGRPLPAKRATDENRLKTKSQLNFEATQCREKGSYGEAAKKHREGFRITEEMKIAAIEALKSMEGVTALFAPYEADAQLAYFARRGIIDLVITEDTDLIVFGCPKIFFPYKESQNESGDGQLYKREYLPLDLTDSQRLRFICVLAGCDYLPGGVKKMGMIKGRELVTEIYSAFSLDGSRIDPLWMFDEMVERSPLVAKSGVTREQFAQAEAAFFDQWVWSDTDATTKVKASNGLPQIEETGSEDSDYSY